MDLQDVRRRLLSKALLTVVGFTVLLTAAFVGIVALFSGDTIGSLGRIPYYVLVLAIAFLVTLWKLDDPERDGFTVLIASAGIAIGAGVLASLATEGLLYAVFNPGDVVGSQLVIYFLAAAILCTGLGIWGLRHWREFTRNYRIE